MGTLRFQLPQDLSAAAFSELERCAIIGGQDNMPFLTEVIVEPQQMLVSRQEDESGSVAVPWNIAGFGNLMTTTATLIERRQPYSLVVELARGQINQLRNQASDWVFGGLQASAELNKRIQEAARGFVKAVALSPAVESIKHAQTAIERAHAAGQQMVEQYIRQVFEVRHQRQEALDTNLGVRLVGPAVPNEAHTAALQEAFNTICVGVAWPTVEPEEGQYNFEPIDRLVDWAINAGFHVVGGPLIDFIPSSLPSFLGNWERDLASIGSFMRDYVETMVRRYKGRIRTWQLTAGANSSDVLGLDEEELLWLTVRMAETARQIDPGLELIIGLSQPWGDYMACSARKHSPFVFVDTLLRTGLNPAALDLEIVMGVDPRGSYCRDLLDVSRIIDLYYLLGVPLQVTLGIPSSTAADPLANPELGVRAGHWRDGITPEVQAEWVAAFGKLAICKPAVRCVQWVHASDAEPHLFPSCGLIDARGQEKPALKQLAGLRKLHLR